MESIFSALGRAVEGTPALALGASFLWGILSILLSPCHLGSIPLIVGFIDFQAPETTRRAFGLSALFALGILVTIAIIGGVTAALGRMMGDVGPWGDYLVAVIFLAVGLHLLGVIPLELRGADGTRMGRRGLLAALALGLVFGIALGPCTFAFMAPVLAVTARLAATSAAYAVLLLLAYGLGHCLVIIVAGTSTGLVQRYLDWTAETRAAQIVRGVCGALVILAGLYMIHRA